MACLNGLQRRASPGETSLASQQTVGETMTEYCADCDRETAHDVRIELQEESTDAEAKNSKFSREPYRVTECTGCKATTTQRMNNA